MTGERGSKSSVVVLGRIFIGNAKRAMVMVRSKLLDERVELGGLKRVGCSTRQTRGTRLREELLGFFVKPFLRAGPKHLVGDS